MESELSIKVSADLSQPRRQIRKMQQDLVKLKTDREFLHWVADRLVLIHGESPNVDFVLKLRKMGGER